MLLDLQSRGLTIDPALVTGDGALVPQGGMEGLVPRSGIYGTTRTQRCWVHKTVPPCGMLNKLPKSQHSKAKAALHEIWMRNARTVAASREEANKAFDRFIAAYESRVPEGGGVSGER